MDNTLNSFTQSGIATIRADLNVRTEPFVNAPIVSVLFSEATVPYQAVITNGSTINGNSTWYKDLNNHYFWSGAVLPSKTLDLPQDNNNLLKAFLPIGITLSNLDLPISKTNCLAAVNWMKTNYATIINEALKDTLFSPELLYAIACQETAIYWVKWINDYEPSEVLGRCIFDASGDVNGKRSVFPKNTADFIAKFGQDKANLLINEANLTRAWRGLVNKSWVYAGYGIFQYDIQYVLTDPDFFFQKKWYYIEDCVSKAKEELLAKQKVYPNDSDLFNIVRAYNGSGPQAVNYAKNVFQFLQWIQEEA